MLKEIARYNKSGISEIESKYYEQMQKETIIKIEGEYIEFLLKDVKVEPKEVIKKDEYYYMYYNGHPSSGYNTEINYDNGHFNIEIKNPEGGVLNALHTEVIIFKVEEQN